jgi:hypothetical protein
LVPVVEKLVLEYGSRIQLVFWGFISTDLLEFSRISRFHECDDEGEAGLMAMLCGSWTGLPFRNFYDKLGRMRPYMALLPLVDCQFNHCKTSLKYLEMSVAGAASIASDITTYQCIQNGHNGLLG